MLSRTSADVLMMSTSADVLSLLLLLLLVQVPVCRDGPA
jgi:hypothetical protein